MKDKPQLFCCTFAGGTAAFFDIIEKELPNIDLVKLEYAGHGCRRKEPMYQDFDALADDMFSRFKEAYSCRQYGLMGYSMGSISVVEVLRRIISDKLMLPSHVFLAAHEPHTKAELLDFTPDELDAWVKERTIQFGAVPEKLINNRPFWRTYLPLYRADYSIIRAYQFEKLDLKTEIPATFFYSETDTPLKEMVFWKNYFVGETDFYRFEGNHFFIQEHISKMAKIIQKKLEV